MSVEDFVQLRLVGGTALALQIGHRKSVDLDLFGEIDFEELNQPEIFRGFREVITLSKSKNINVFSIEGIKVEIQETVSQHMKGH